MTGSNLQCAEPSATLKAIPKRGARVPLELKKIGLSSDEKMRELYKISGGGGCLNYSGFIEKILYYGCQRYEYDILPVELRERPFPQKELHVRDENTRSGNLIHCSDRFKGGGKA